MEELNVSGVVVGAEDYREADRIVRILTPDRGVIRAVMRGVKKEKAKLKFAAMPFAFCEYSLMKRGAYYTVKTASPIEPVRSDPLSGRLPRRFGHAGSGGGSRGGERRDRRIPAPAHDA